MNSATRCMAMMGLGLTLMLGCGDSETGESDTSLNADTLESEDAEVADPTSGEDPCKTRRCGEPCGEDWRDGLYCDLEGVCRLIGDEVLYCPSECLDAECGASCQPSCAIGRRCGFIAPGYCNPEGQCILEEPGGPAGRPFECPDD